MVRPRSEKGNARSAIFESAIQEFAEKGYAGATTIGIARRARTRQPLVHHYFGTKEKLFRAVLDELFAELVTELDHVLASSEGDSSDARELLRRVVMLSASHRELARIWVIESGQGGRPAKYLRDKHVRPLSERIVGWLARHGRADFALEADPELLVYAFQGLASFPFLVSDQVKRLAHGNARDPAFAAAYADLVVSLVYGARSAMPGAARSTATVAEAPGPS